MNLLLDTHAFIWYIEGNDKLSSTSLDLIEDTDNNIFLSIASLWEISIKLKLNKLHLQVQYEILENILRKLSISILPITFEDTIINLNLERHHNDPFDHIIISQAISNDLFIIGNDTKFRLYKINVIW